MRIKILLFLLLSFPLFVFSGQLTENQAWYSNQDEYTKLDDLYQKAANLKQLDEKISIYNKIIQKENKSLTALVLRGIASGKLGNLKSAINDFTTASEISPTDPFPIINRAYAFLLMHKYSESINDYNKAIKMKPEEASFYASRGYAFYIQNNHKRALADFKTALSFDSENTVYKHNITVIEEDSN